MDVERWTLNLDVQIQPLKGICRSIHPSIHRLSSLQCGMGLSKIELLKYTDVKPIKIEKKFQDEYNLEPPQH